MFVCYCKSSVTGAPANSPNLHVHGQPIRLCDYKWWYEKYKLYKVYIYKVYVYMADCASCEMCLHGARIAGARSGCLGQHGFLYRRCRCHTVLGLCGEFLQQKCSIPRPRSTHHVWMIDTLSSCKIHTFMVKVIWLKIKLFRAEVCVICSFVSKC